MLQRLAPSFSAASGHGEASMLLCLGVEESGLILPFQRFSTTLLAYIAHCRQFASIHFAQVQYMH